MAKSSFKLVCDYGKLNIKECNRVLLPSVVVSADEAVATDPQFLKFWKIKLFATMSMASSSSPIQHL